LLQCVKKEREEGGERGGPNALRKEGLGKKKKKKDADPDSPVKEEKKKNPGTF